MMNEITRIHIAKIAYEIEIDAKKNLAKYLKNLEAYIQDDEIFNDIEIRVTELLAESGVKPGGVITNNEITAIQAQLGEPHDFADNETEPGNGDFAIGDASDTSSKRRLFRSTDKAMLGGVLAGIARYLKIDALWLRLAFIAILLLSFGLAAFAYALLWIVIPPAKTATEKLQMAGEEVTASSIKNLTVTEPRVPILQKILGIAAGITAATGALITLGLTLWLVIATLTGNELVADMTNGFLGLGNEYQWLVWLLFWIVVFGLVMLISLLVLVAYALFARRLTKKSLIIGIAILILGIASVAAVLGIGSSQSIRVANETRSLVRETKANLPAEFNNVQSVTFAKRVTDKNADANYLSTNPAIRYVVDNGPARYELTGLPGTRPVIAINGSDATVTLAVSDSFRNSFVQPLLTIYGPALEKVTATNEDDRSVQVSYDSTTRSSLAIRPNSSYLYLSGSYDTVTVEGEGQATVSDATIDTLIVLADHGLQVDAGTVRTLRVSQPTACPSNAHNETIVRVTGITAGEMTYNDATLPAATHTTNCGRVIVSTDDAYEE